MKKFFVLLLSLISAIAFTSCKKLPENISSVNESDIFVSDGPTFSSSSSEQTSNEEEIISYTQTETVPSTTSSQVTSSTTQIISKCTHPDYWEGHTGLHWIGFWNEIEPGVEYRREIFAECEEPRKVVYKCPKCFEPILYETLSPRGHDFSGEEEVIHYPTLHSEGSWGKTCQSITCNETTLTTAIPKRGGSYETIDSCFTINGNDYAIDNPDVIIMDRRTWGDVPTIVFNTESLAGTITYALQDGSSYESSIILDKDLLSEGWGYRGTILDSGIYKVEYSRWGFNGVTS